MRFCRLVLPFLLVVIWYPSQLAANTRTQNLQDQQCEFPIVKSSEVDHRLKILAKPEPEFNENDRREFAYKVVVLTATFCGSGKVIDLKVKRSVSDSIDAKAIEAAKKIEFVPADKGGKKVSQILTLEYHV